MRKTCKKRFCKSLRPQSWFIIQEVDFAFVFILTARTWKTYSSACLCPVVQTKELEPTLNVKYFHRAANNNLLVNFTFFMSSLWQRPSSLFVFSMGGPKQNVNSFWTPFSETSFYALSRGSLGFALHVSFFNHFLVGLVIQQPIGHRLGKVCLGRLQKVHQGRFLGVKQGRRHFDKKVKVSRLIFQPYAKS